MLSIGRQSTGDERAAHEVSMHTGALLCWNDLYTEKRCCVAAIYAGSLPSSPSRAQPLPAGPESVGTGNAASMCFAACFVSLAAPVSSAYTSGVTTSQPQAAGMRRKTAHNLAALPAAPIQHDLASVRTTTANPSFGLALGMPQARVRGTRSASTKPSNATCAARGARTASASPAGMGTTHDSAAASTS